MAAILLVGIVAYSQQPVSALPKVDYPTIQVLTFYPSANPDVMATTVTVPLERQFGQMPGLNQDHIDQFWQILNHCAGVQSQPKNQRAQEEVQSAINAARSYLP
jgi:multidrug efflux pump